MSPLGMGGSFSTGSPLPALPVLVLWHWQQQELPWQLGGRKGRQEQWHCPGEASPSPLMSILSNTMSVNSSAVIFSLQRLMDRMAWGERGAQGSLRALQVCVCVTTRGQMAKHERPNPFSGLKLVFRQLGFKRTKSCLESWRLRSPKKVSDAL